MSVLHITDRTGDTQLMWTKGEASEAEVQAKFEEVIEQGYMAFRVDGPTSGSVIRTFEPEAEHIIMTAPMVGG